VVETPLTDEQKVVEEDDGWVRIEARVVDTRVLRGWLLSFGQMAEVVGPKSLRGALRQTAEEMVARYR
jgi:predicted DNA-binding transcriptional regulator YafY